MADVGGTRKVTGNKIATPLTDPNPGIAPIKSPAKHPAKIMKRFSGSNDCNRPFPSKVIISVIFIS
jgi:hypothetical protein